MSEKDRALEEENFCRWRLARVKREADDAEVELARLQRRLAAGDVHTLETDMVDGLAKLLRKGMGISTTPPVTPRTRNWGRRQGKSSWTVLEMHMSDEDIRNSIIVELSKVTHTAVSDLQSLSSRSLVEMVRDTAAADCAGQNRYALRD